MSESLLNNVAILLKETPELVHHCEYREILKNSFFCRTLPVPASALFNGVIGAVFSFSGEVGVLMIRLRIPDQGL